MFGKSLFNLKFKLLAYNVKNSTVSEILTCDQNWIRIRLWRTKRTTLKKVRYEKRQREGIFSLIPYLLNQALDIRHYLKLIVLGKDQTFPLFSVADP